MQTCYSHATIKKKAKRKRKMIKLLCIEKVDKQLNEKENQFMGFDNINELHRG